MVVDKRDKITTEKNNQLAGKTGFLQRISEK
jgi:hypothetical protein